MALHPVTAATGRLDLHQPTDELFGRHWLADRPRRLDLADETVGPAATAERTVAIGVGIRQVPQERLPSNERRPFTSVSLPGRGRLTSPFFSLGAHTQGEGVRYSCHPQAQRARTSGWRTVAAYRAQRPFRSTCL